MGLGVRVGVTSLLEPIVLPRGEQQRDLTPVPVGGRVRVRGRVRVKVRGRVRVRVKVRVRVRV